MAVERSRYFDQVETLRPVWLAGLTVVRRFHILQPDLVYWKKQASYARHDF